MNATELLGLGRSRLQQIAKHHGVKANQKTANIVEELLHKFPDGVPRSEDKAAGEETSKNKDTPIKRRGEERNARTTRAEGPRIAVANTTTAEGEAAELSSIPIPDIPPMADSISNARYRPRTDVRRTSPRVSVSTRKESGAVAPAKVVDVPTSVGGGMVEGATSSHVVPKQSRTFGDGLGNQAGSSKGQALIFPPGPVFSLPSPSKRHLGAVFAKPGDVVPKKGEPSTRREPVFTLPVALMDKTKQLSARSRLQKRLSLLTGDEEQEVLDDIQVLENLKNSLQFDLEVIGDYAETLNKTTEAMNKQVTGANAKMEKMQQTFQDLMNKINYGVPLSQVEEYEDDEDFTVSQLDDTTTTSSISPDKGKRKAYAEDTTDSVESPRKRSRTAEAVGDISGRQGST